MSTITILYRAVSHAELLDIIQTGGMRPAPPSNQGKWFAESLHDVSRWGHLFYHISQLPFHIIEVEVPSVIGDRWYRNTMHDRIGPARYAEVGDLASIRFVREISPIYLRST